jgi:competence protein CoiA
VWHWACKSRTNCDRWWEPEAEWHRGWKNRFSDSWQEVVLPDPHTGERHVADVQTASGLVIEFQRSSIHSDEMQARETFYGNMIWVLDGCQNDADKYNFANTRSPPDEQGLAQFEWYGRSIALCAMAYRQTGIH